MICNPHQILFGPSNQEELDGRGMWHVRETGELHTGFWWADLTERGHLKDLGVDGRITDLREVAWGGAHGLD
jgi:hypothetical protein